MKLFYKIYFCIWSIMLSNDCRQVINNKKVSFLEGHIWVLFLMLGSFLICSIIKEIKKELS